MKYSPKQQTPNQRVNGQTYILRKPLYLRMDILHHRRTSNHNCIYLTHCAHVFYLTYVRLYFFVREKNLNLKDLIASTFKQQEKQWRSRFSSQWFEKWWLPKLCHSIPDSFVFHCFEPCIFCSIDCERRTWLGGED